MRITVAMVTETKHPTVVTRGAPQPRFGATMGQWRGIYVGEVLAAEGARPDLVEFYSKLILGVCKNMAPGSFWPGLIDEVRIYNRAVKIIGR